MDKKCVICGEMMYNVRSDKLYCSNTCRNKAQWKRQKSGIDLSKKNCLKCGKEFQITKSGYSRKYCYDCVPKDSYKSGASMRQLIKQWALEYKGNKCECCGYDKTSWALELHHKDPTKKDFNISDRDIHLDWPAIKEELDKSILVCANCHREIHAGVRKI